MSATISTETTSWGQLLTSDNYDDNEKKVVGGRNGRGPELLMWW